MKTIAVLLSTALAAVGSEEIAKCKELVSSGDATKVETCKSLCDSLAPTMPDRATGEDIAFGLYVRFGMINSCSVPENLMPTQPSSARALSLSVDNIAKCKELVSSTDPAQVNMCKSLCESEAPRFGSFESGERLASHMYIQYNSKYQCTVPDELMPPRLLGSADASKIARCKELMTSADPSLVETCKNKCETDAQMHPDKTTGEDLATTMWVQYHILYSCSVPNEYIPYKSSERSLTASPEEVVTRCQEIMGSSDPAMIDSCKNLCQVEAIKHPFISCGEMVASNVYLFYNGAPWSCTIPDELQPANLAGKPSPCQ